MSDDVCVFNLRIFSIDKVKDHDQELVLECLEAMTQVVLEVKVNSALQKLNERLHLFNSVLLFFDKLVFFLLGRNLARDRGLLGGVRGLWALVLDILLWLFIGIGA